MSKPLAFLPPAATNGHRLSVSVGPLQARSSKARVLRRPHAGYASDIATEVKVVWLEPIAGYDYVREEMLVAFGPTRGRPRCKVDGRLIGYTLLGPGERGTTPRNYVRFRRLFVLRDYDRGEPGCTTPRDAYWDDHCPGEAVDPRTVMPGVPGLQTARCWGDAS